MTLHLLLDSRLARQQRGRHNLKTHDFQIFFDPLIQLDSSKNHEAALNELITMTYSWHNVAAKYNNNQFKWRKKGDAAWKTLTVPDGMYSYTNLVAYIQEHIGYVDKDAAEKQYIFNLYFDFTIYRVVIGLEKGNYEQDLSVGEFGEFIGFNKKVLQNASSFVGDKIPDITRGVGWVFIHCDLITRKVQDVASDVLFSLSTVGLPVSYPYRKEPRRLKFHPVDSSTMDSIAVRITDGRNHVLDLNGSDVSLALVIREVE